MQIELAQFSTVSLVIWIESSCSSASFRLLSSLWWDIQEERRSWRRWELEESTGCSQGFKGEQIMASTILCSQSCDILACDTFLHHLESQELWEKLGCYVIRRLQISQKLFPLRTIAGLPAKLNPAQLRRQAGQCLIMCRRWIFTCAAALSQVGRRHMRTRLKTY